MGGQIPWDPDFVRVVQGLTKKYGTVWLIDEVVTGFRDSPGGWQATIGVTPDLTSLGKCAGGGLAVGVLGGRADIMNMLKPKAPPQQFVTHSGTWNANPLTAAAGIAACKLYKSGEVQQKVNQLGAYLREKGSKALKERGINSHLYGKTLIHLYIGPIGQKLSEDTAPTKDFFSITAGSATQQRLCLHLLHRGIATMGARFFSLSIAHSEDDIDQTVKALCDSLDAMIAEGTMNQTT
jgi:glutamate-1-semialdehyde 2,1-aminomutase